MNPDYSFRTESLPGILGMVTTLVCFLAYWFIAHSSWLESYISKRYPQNGQTVIFPLAQKYVGALFLGVIPAIVMFSILPYPPSSYFLSNADWSMTMIWSVGLILLLILMNRFSAARSSIQEVYPQVRATHWSPSLVFHNSAAWITYLFAYELLFRGLLLYSCMQSMDLWLAVVINVALYSVAHLPKGLTESLITIPFGIIVCLFTIASGGIWIALALHVGHALSNDFFAVYHHPEMKYVRSDSLRVR